MSDENTTLVPVWTLSTTSSAHVPFATGDGALTPERLAELRSALAAFSDAPLVTLEAHPLTKKRGRSAGIPLEAVSPLAQELSRLVAQNSRNVPAVAKVAESSEVLYRMVVPAKVAAQFGKGLVKPMASKAVANGVYGDLVGAGSTVAAKATLVPVSTVSASGAAGAAAGTVVAGTAMTVAAPLILMAVALGASAHADQQRQKAIEHITELLEKLHDEKLEHERSELDGCRDAIDKATALLLDQGKIGASLGLDSAVHAIGKATEMADRRLRKWESELDALGDDRVEATDLEEAFGGIGEEGGEFRTHLELAALAIALKRRVIVLQGVEAGQSDDGNPFENFVRSLKADQQRINELEARIANVLVRLSSLELRSPKRLIDKVMTRRQVDGLLEASYRLRALAEDVAAADPAAEVIIEIEKHSDGTLLVLPARTA
ncbi:MAG: hypothetical protein H7288_20795 [Kineosporiaceae bacterium]|nr:hypothetical protein [Aeromicrobium sp.]